MPTRLKRPPFWRPLALTVALLGFQGYLGFSAIGGQFGIESIPTMWLIDRKGNLRDVDAREDLAAKVAKLLAE